MMTLYKDKNADQLSDTLSEPEDLEKKAFLKKKILKKTSRKNPWKRKIFVISVWGIFIFVALLAYPAFKGRRVIPGMPSMRWFPVRNAQSIRFESFIIPFKEPGKCTYISLSISFKLPNKELMDEMILKNTRIRGVIYSILSNNINILKNVSSLKKLKELITNGVNGILKDGKVNEAIITDFSMV